MLTGTRLERLLKYSPDEGLFYWVDGGGKPCKQAGSTSGRYVRIAIDGRSYRAHHLAWLWMTGDWPPINLDHEDTNKHNNKWNNLRIATRSQNMANRGPQINNKSGFKGVSRYRAGESYGKPWQASIQKDGKTRHIGHFATAEDAAAAYRSAAQKLFGEFGRAN